MFISLIRKALIVNGSTQCRVITFQCDRDVYHGVTKHLATYSGNCLVSSKVVWAWFEHAVRTHWKGRWCILVFVRIFQPIFYWLEKNVNNMQQASVISTTWNTARLLNKDNLVSQHTFENSILNQLERGKEHNILSNACISGFASLTAAFDRSNASCDFVYRLWRTRTLRKHCYVSHLCLKSQHLNTVLNITYIV